MVFSACSNVSCPNNAISRDGLALLKAITSASERTAIGAGDPLRYAPRSAFNSVSSTVNSLPPIALSSNALISTSTAPCAFKTARASANTASVPNPAANRITPIRAPLSVPG